MKKQLINKILIPYLLPHFVLGLVVILGFTNVSSVMALVLFAIELLLLGYTITYTEKTILPWVSQQEETLIQENDKIMHTITESDAVPLCCVEHSGSIHWQNKMFEQLCQENGDAAKILNDDRLSELFSGEKQVQFKVRWGERIYVADSTQLEGDASKRLLIWTDVTSAEEIRRLHREKKLCAACINVDNYDEIIADTPTDEQSSIEAAIDVKLRAWASDMDAAVVRFKAGSYVIFFEQRHMETLRDGKFAILNDMHEISTGADFPTSISIGVGCEAPLPEDLLQDARQALDLALGRGGDQAVVRRKSGENEYYGGALPTVEKRNKGKSRMVAHALLQQMSSADKILIMGHARPDMDAFGSAIGLYHLAEVAGKDASIVLNTVDEAIQQIYDAAVATGRYHICSAEEVKDSITENTLLIVTDCHAKFITEAPELVDLVQRIVIVDHHRRTRGPIENATLVHAEVYASSASELVTELLQYSGKKVIDKFAAGALLAGITVDTKNFTVNTGVRTFEAASWLRRNGADMADVKNYFRLRLDFVQKKYNIIASAEILEGGVAVAYTKETDPSMQVLAAQAADELLEMKGVRAAFASGVGAKATMVSARSDGSINVQTVMERMGGGGHMNVAAAQVQMSPEEAIQQIVAILREDEVI